MEVNNKFFIFAQSIEDYQSEAIKNSENTEVFLNYQFTKSPCCLHRQFVRLTNARCNQHAPFVSLTNTPCYPHEDFVRHTNRWCCQHRRFVRLTKPSCCQHAFFGTRTNNQLNRMTSNC